jgi:hypothetical protein
MVMKCTTGASSSACTFPTHGRPTPLEKTNYHQ